MSTHAELRREYDARMAQRWHDEDEECCYRDPECDWCETLRACPDCDVDPDALRPGDTDSHLCCAKHDAEEKWQGERHGRAVELCKALNRHLRQTLKELAKEQEEREEQKEREANNRARDARALNRAARE